MTIKIDDGLLVIHAMDIRPKYLGRYNEATSSEADEETNG